MMEGTAHPGWLQRLSCLRVLVIGDLMADKYVWGSDLRLSREAPVPVIHVGHEDYVPGGAANVARNLRSLGARVHLAGVVGYDDAAYSLGRALSQAGISAAGLFPSSLRPTTLKVRVMSTRHSHLVARFDYETDLVVTGEEAASILQFARTYMDAVDLLVLSDYGKGVLRSADMVDGLVGLAREHGRRVIGLAREGQLALFRGVDLLATGQSDACSFLARDGRPVPAEPQAGAALAEHLAVPRVLLHDALGLHGIRVDYWDGCAFSQSFQDGGTLNTIGVGDSVAATGALALAAGADGEELVRATQAAALVVRRKVGTGAVDYAELVEALKAGSGVPSAAGGGRPLDGRLEDLQPGRA